MTGTVKFSGIEAMHELPITTSIFRSVVGKAESVGASSVNRVVLEIGILRDYVPEIVQKYWDYISKGSIAEGSVIEIREIDAIAACGCCGNEYNITRETITDAHCPACGYRYGKILAGNELHIVGIEIERKSN